MKQSELAALVARMRIEDVGKALDILASKGKGWENLEVFEPALHDRFEEHTVNQMEISEVIISYNNLARTGFDDEGNLETYLKTKILNKMNREDLRAAVDSMTNRKVA